jgi:hypothetical protein
MFHFKNFAKRLSAATGGLAAALATAVVAVPAVLPVVGMPFGEMMNKTAKWTTDCFKYAQDAKHAHPIVDKTAKSGPPRPT